MEELVRTLTVENKLGIHARVATKVVNLFNKYPELEAELEKDDIAVNGKSMMGVLMLAAAYGEEVKVKLKGPKENCLSAYNSLLEILTGE